MADEQSRLWQTVEAAPPLGPNLPVRIPRSDDWPERTAQFVLRALPVTIPPPAYRSAEHLPATRVVAILAQEVEPPPDVKSVSWMLLTTLPVTSYEQAVQCLRWCTTAGGSNASTYTLKSGCRIEKLQLETAFRIRTALAAYCLVAWRLLYLTYAAREQPEQPCMLFLTEAERQALYARIHRTRTVPAEPPGARTAVRWIAKLGGFLGRTSDGEPGLKVLWRGFRILQFVVEDWLIFRHNT